MLSSFFNARADFFDKMYGARFYDNCGTCHVVNFFPSTFVLRREGGRKRMEEKGMSKGKMEEGRDGRWKMTGGLWNQLSWVSVH